METASGKRSVGRTLARLRDDLHRRIGGQAATGCKKQLSGFWGVPCERLMSSGGLQRADNDDEICIALSLTNFV